MKRQMILASVLMAVIGAGAASPAEASVPFVLRAELVAAQDAGRAQGIAEQIGSLLSQIDSLRSRYGGLPAGDQVLLEEQVSRRRQRIGALLDQLVSEVVSLREAGTPAPEPDSLAVRLTGIASSWLRDAIEESALEVDRVRQSLEEATEEERSVLTQDVEAEMARLDRLLEALHQNTLRQDRLGLDSSDDAAFLEDRLGVRGDVLAARVTAETEAVARLRNQLKTASEAQAPDVGTQLARQQEELRRDVASLTATANLMRARGLDQSEYREVLFDATGDVTPDILDAEMLRRLLSRTGENLRTWLSGNASRLALHAVLFLVILLFTWIAARVVRRLVSRALSRSGLNVTQLLQDTFVSWSAKLVWLVGLLLAFAQLGLNVGPMLAGLGVAGFVVGFALQDTLGNFAAGMMILVYRPFDVDDVVEAGGAFGKVSAMSLVSTTILTFDNQRLIIPNGKIWGDVIRNATAEESRRVDLVFGISYADDIGAAEAVLKDIVAAHPKILADPEPMIRVHKLGESSVDFIVRPWAKTADYWDVYWDLTRSVKERFDSSGISIPFPQRDVHLYQASTGESPPGDEVRATPGT